jgi:hypothetical protein
MIVRFTIAITVPEVLTLQLIEFYYLSFPSVMQRSYKKTKEQSEYEAENLIANLIAYFNNTDKDKE